MRVHPISSQSHERSFASRALTKTRVGFALGILATAFSLPFVSSKSISADESQGKNTKRILSEGDIATIEALRKFDKERDLKVQETDWAKFVEPTTKQALINLYEAEKKDNQSLKERKIEEKDRKVKIFLADFVLPNQRGDDGGIGPSLHIVKYDGKTYVNEHWPINESTGGVLPTETIRVRTQTFKGPLNKEGAENLFVTDMLQLIWDNNDIGNHPGSPYPYLYRQNLYGNYKKARKENELQNEVNQVQTLVSSPLKCMSCHRSGATFTQDIFLKPWEKRTNFGAITPDNEFEKPFNEQRGFKKYLKYLNERVQKKESTQAYVNSIKKALMNSTRLENPYIVEALKENETIPWVGADILSSEDPKLLYDSRFIGLTYKVGENTRINAGYVYFHGQLIDWWLRESQQLIP